MHTLANSMHVMLMTLTSRRISSSDIKDKSQLTEARKSVERQMERFKVQTVKLHSFQSKIGYNIQCGRLCVDLVQESIVPYRFARRR